jgi:uncharacterized repeat protein (TIGR02543 family)
MSMNNVNRSLLILLAAILTACTDPLKAGQAPAVYTITFQVNDGTDTALTEKTVTAPVTSLPAADFPDALTRSGYTFGGWNTARDGSGTVFDASTPVTGDITVYAQWTAVQYTVTFNADGGSPATRTRTVASGNSVGASNMPSEPGKSGYTFGGWYTSTGGGGTRFTASTPVTGDLTVYAQWQENTPPPAQYTVTFDSHGGTGVAAVTANAGTAVAKPADPTRAGYTFAGWFSATSGGTQYTWPHTLTGNVTMNARWTAISYAITYVLNGGTNAAGNPATYTAESAVVLAAPALAGQGFEGWYETAGFTGNAVTTIPAGSTGDKTFYARWAAAYAIAYVLNGGTNAAQNPAIYTGTRAVVLAAASRAGYAFGGWYDNAGFAGSAVASIPAGSAGDKTFYAKWIPAAVSGLGGSSGDRAASLTWTDPAGTDLASIEITWSPGGTSPQTVAGGTQTYTAIGLTNGTAYVFTVVVVDAAGGRSAGAAITLTPTAAAKVSVSFTALPQDEAIALSGVQALSWSDNTALTVSVSGGFTAYRWDMDGAALSGETGGSLSLNARDLSIKKHTLTVFVTADGVEYAKSVSFVVEL